MTLRALRILSWLLHFSVTSFMWGVKVNDGSIRTPSIFFQGQGRIFELDLEMGWKLPLPWSKRSDGRFLWGSSEAVVFCPFHYWWE